MPQPPTDPSELLAAIVRAHEGIDAAKALRQHSVQAALDAGVPATTIAEALGVSRYRVYQIRDGK